MSDYPEKGQDSHIYNHPISYFVNHRNHTSSNEHNNIHYKEHMYVLCDCRTCSNKYCPCNCHRGKTIPTQYSNSILLSKDISKHNAYENIDYHQTTSCDCQICTNENCQCICHSSHQTHLPQHCLVLNNESHNLLTNDYCYRQINDECNCINCYVELCSCICHFNISPAINQDDNVDSNIINDSNIEKHDTGCECQTCTSIICSYTRPNTLQCYTADKKSDLKIAFINVNGLSKKSKYPEFSDFVNKYDIVGIGESNMIEKENLDLDNFFLLKTKQRPNAFKTTGGITVLVKNEMKPFVRYIPTESDYVLWLEVDKGVINSENTIIIGVVYIPGENSIYTCCDAYDIINQERIEFFHDKENVILGGDFNSRTKTLKDFIPRIDTHDQNDELTHAYSLSKENFFEHHNISKERFNQDTARPNNYGNKLIDFCNNNNFIILNGRCGHDKNIGKVTCKGVSLVDYVLMYSESKLNIKDFEVKDFSVLLSDVHNPVCLTIDNHNENDFIVRNISEENINDDIVDPNILDNKFNNKSIPQRWDSVKVEAYKDELKK